MALVFDEQNHYCRSYSPEVNRLTDILSKNYQASTFIVPSGMNAISTVLHSLCTKPYTLVYTDELYTDTPRLFGDMAHRYGLELVKTSDPNITKRDTILYFETCSNPHGYIFPFEKIVEWKKQHPSLIVIADNTWVTSSVMNPLDHGVDIVVSSLTKYYSNGQAMGGMIATRTFSEPIEKYIRFHGIHTSRHNCQVVINNIHNLPNRLEQAHSVMQQLFILLLNDPNFTDLMHPSLKSHPSFSRYEQYFKPNLGPHVFTVKIKGNNKAIKNKIPKFKHIIYQTSFGNEHTKLDPWHIITKGGYTECRIAVGYNSSAEDIYKDLKLLTIP